MYNAYYMYPDHPNVYWGNGPMYPYRYMPAPGYWAVPNEVRPEHSDEPLYHDKHKPISSWLFSGVHFAIVLPMLAFLFQGSKRFFLHHEIPELLCQA